MDTLGKRYKVSSTGSPDENKGVILRASSTGFDIGKSSEIGIDAGKACVDRSDVSERDMSEAHNRVTSSQAHIGKLNTDYPIVGLQLDLPVGGIRSPGALDEELKSSTVRTIDGACNLARRWLPPITEADKVTLMEVLNGTESTYGTPLLRKYIELLRPYTEILGVSGKNNKPREADCVASGLVFFYGCLFYIMHFPGWGRHIEDIFLYNLLYILVDHYIDDIRVDINLKDQAITQMFILIKDPLAHERLPLIDPILKTIATVYHRLITRCPNTQPFIIKLFKAEIEGITIQKSNSCTREQYYDIALRKGGYTMEVLQHIVGNTDPTIPAASFQIGTIMQLIDDITDVMTDKSNGIHTIATHELATYGNLDNLWVDIMNSINIIDDRFTIFKILYTIFAVYVPDRCRENFSVKLWSQTTRMNLFDYTYGCDGSALLVDAIMNELVAIETLELARSMAITKH